MPPEQAHDALKCDRQWRFALRDRWGALVLSRPSCRL